MRERHKLVNRFKNQGSLLNDKETKIVNYILAKKSPVYGFVNFLHKKTHSHPVIKKPPVAKAYSDISKAVDVQEMQQCTDQNEIKNMSRQFNIRQQKKEVMKLIGQAIIKISLKIFRTYFTEKVYKRMVTIFMEATMRSYRKLKIINSRKARAASVNRKQSVPNLIKKVFNAREISTKQDQQNKIDILSKNNSKAFIGRIKRVQMFKKKVIHKRRRRMETFTELPILSRHPTTTSSPSNTNLKIAQERVPESSSKYKTHKKPDTETPKQESGKLYPQENIKLSSSPFTKGSDLRPTNASIQENDR